MPDWSTEALKFEKVNKVKKIVSELNLFSAWTYVCELSISTKFPIN